MSGGWASTSTDVSTQAPFGDRAMGESISRDSQPDNEQPILDPRPRTDWVRALFPIALALVFSVIVILLITRFREKVESLGGYSYLGAFIVGFLGNATVILPAPSLVFTAALGGVLNPLLVGFVVGAGEALGEMTGYLAGIGGTKILDKHARYQSVQNYMDKYGGWVFFVLAAIPNPLFDVAGIAGGMIRFPVWQFLFSTWVGKTLKAILFAGFGRQLLN